MRNRNSGNCNLSDWRNGWFATVSFSLIVASFFGSFLASGSLTAAPVKDEVAVTQKRTGKIADSSLLSKRPPAGVVANQASWKSLWSAWRAGEELLEVDFQNQIVLVATANGPNLVFTSSINLTPSGDLRYETASTKMGGPGFGYALLVIPRAGVLTVNGKTIPVNSPKISPLESTTPPSPKPMVGDAVESIRVEIQGRVRTGVLSRGNSTGTMVVANGIVWELDLRNDAKLIDAARKLGTDVGSIKGTLSKLSNPDRSIRWVVDVESIAAAISPGGLPNVAGDSTKPPASLSQMSKAETMSNMKGIAMSKPDSKMSSKVPTESLNIRRRGFKSIVISATGGQSRLERKQIVSADGSVTLEVPRTNYSESFTLDPTSLLDLHRFVASTDWQSVPRSSVTEGEDVTNFSIMVDTQNGTRRFLTDAVSIDSQPVFNKLFSLMQKPKTKQ